MKTYSAKASEIEKKWVVIDAEDAVVGRLTTEPSYDADNAFAGTTTPVTITQWQPEERKY